MNFQEAYTKFWQDLGQARKMVLSTALDDIVTSRMMSLIILDRKLYFQTDKTFRKYSQLKGNPYAALCADNIQIEGRCSEAGHPMEYEAFSAAYKEHFCNSYDRYSALENERLFVMEPDFIERWLYIDGVPYMESFGIKKETYILKQYYGV